jgi:hypothetical protein
MKIGLAVMNFFFRLRRTSFRIFPHSTRVVDALVSSNGLKRVYYHRTLAWQVMVYSR